ncbi:MAG: D-tyrosyl-tRNA(Tyr) deacylase [Planctomycetes bacterium]|nr:D-tyrosyl-tRNA(Tyr) deacylase [Planctomycetota bacterium]
MRALIQRVGEASVDVAGRRVGAIGRGLVVLLGAGHDDLPDDVAWLAGKIARLRIFADDAGLMNRSLVDVAGEILVVSQFTLFAQTAAGNRPSFIRAARPEQARPLYDAFIAALAGLLTRPVATGEFGADMRLALVNDGPVTIWIDSRARE